MGLLDTVSGLFGSSKGKKKGDNPLGDLLADGKIDANDLKDVVTDQLDANSDGKLDAADIAGNLGRLGETNSKKN